MASFNIASNQDNPSGTWGNYIYAGWLEFYSPDLGALGVGISRDEYLSAWTSTNAAFSLRFTNITIPKGATINSAKIHLKIDSSTGSGGYANIDIRADAADNSTQILTQAAQAARVRTTASVNWAATLTLSTEYDTPELKTVVQEIVNRAGWLSGNAIQFIFEDHNYRPYPTLPGGSVREEGWGFQANSVFPMVLTVDYYLDIGVRVRTSSTNINIGAEILTASHKLRIRDGGITYGIPLIATSDANASGIRIYDGVSIKALPKK